MKRKKTISDIVSTGSCTSGDWEAMALEDENFDLLLAAFPNRFAVHFPRGRPFLANNTWPPGEVRAHYRERVSEFSQSLRQAKQIFIVAPAGQDVSARNNHLAAVKRMDLVSQIIENVIYEDVPESERDNHRVPLRSFSWPPSRPFKPQRYRDTYLRDPGGVAPSGPDPLVSWDEKSQSDFARSFENAALMRDPSSEEWRDLFNSINRAVLVIPVPCLGDEYLAAE